MKTEKWTLKELVEFLEGASKRDLVGECYSNFTFLSSGSTRSVYQVPLVNGEEVVVKIQRQSRDSHANKREVAVWKKIGLPFLAEIYASDASDKCNWLIMEYIPKQMTHQEAYKIHMSVSYKGEGEDPSCPNKFKDFVKFLRENKIKYDLHEGNMGFRSGCPVMIDYAEVELKFEIK